MKKLVIFLLICFTNGYCYSKGRGMNGSVGTNPDNFYPEYSGTSSKGASEIRVIAHMHVRAIWKANELYVGCFEKKFEVK